MDAWVEVEGVGLRVTGGFMPVRLYERSGNAGSADASSDAIAGMSRPIRDGFAMLLGMASCQFPPRLNEPSMRLVQHAQERQAAQPLRRPPRDRLAYTEADQRRAFR